MAQNKETRTPSDQESEAPASSSTMLLANTQLMPVSCPKHVVAQIQKFLDDVEALHIAFSTEGQQLYHSSKSVDLFPRRTLTELSELAKRLAAQGIDEAAGQLGPFRARINQLRGANGTALLITISQGPPAQSVAAELSDRQLDVCLAASKGFTVRQMAQKLRISENTVKSHLKHCYALLGVSSRVQLAQKLGVNR